MRVCVKVGREGGDHLQKLLLEHQHLQMLVLEHQQRLLRLEHLQRAHFANPNPTSQ